MSTLNEQRKIAFNRIVEEFREAIFTYYQKYGTSVPQVMHFRIGYLGFFFTLIATYFAERLIFGPVAEFFLHQSNSPIPPEVGVWILPFILVVIDLLLASQYYNSYTQRIQNEQNLLDHTLNIPSRNRFAFRPIYILLAMLFPLLCSYFLYLEAYKDTNPFSFFLISSLAIVSHLILFISFRILEHFLNYIENTFHSRSYRRILVLYNHILVIQQEVRRNNLSMQDFEIRLNDSETRVLQALGIIPQNAVHSEGSGADAQRNQHMQGNQEFPSSNGFLNNGGSPIQNDHQDQNDYNQDQQEEHDQTENDSSNPFFTNI